MSLPPIFGVTFAHPWVLLLLPALPLIAWFRGKRGGAPSIIFSSITDLRIIGHLRRSKAGAILTSLLLLAEALLIVALARPQRGKELQQIKASGIDIILAIDVSRSMLAEDFTIGNERANRLEAVKQVTERFINARPNDRIGIVAFAGRPYLVSPLTLDHDWLLKNLERLNVGLVEDGTAIGSAIVSSANRLKERAAKSKIIVLLTDGDNNSGKVNPTTAAEAAHALGLKIYTIGAGTRGYAPVPVPMFGQIVYRNVKVEVDEETLKKIAAIANGQFYRATDSKSLQQIFDQIDRLEKSVIETRQYTQYRDLFIWPLMPAFGLLLVYLAGMQSFFRRLP
jgi:Ca-activated chloride channel family protein